MKSERLAWEGEQWLDEESSLAREGEGWLHRQEELSGVYCRPLTGPVRAIKTF